MGKGSAQTGSTEFILRKVLVNPFCLPCPVLVRFRGVWSRGEHNIQTDALYLNLARQKV